MDEDMNGGDVVDDVGDLYREAKSWGLLPLDEWEQERITRASEEATP